MLKENVVTVVHPLFGTIRLSKELAKVLELPPFRDMAFKSQLGNKALSTSLLNAKHTRLMHSVGVMYLTSKLLDSCERKFSKYFKITKQEREALELAALGHDVGHVAFSHSLEDKDMKSHEERTIEIFKKYADQINSIFGYDITSSVISIYKNNEEVKRQGSNEGKIDKIDVLFVFTSLLVGTIDCDRMEYIMTDRYMVFGERVDFTRIFDYITIVLINDTPTVGFEKAAVPIIENMLLTRFDQYESIYYAETEDSIEMALKEYVRESGWSTEYKESLMEFDILSDMYKTLQKGDKTSKLYRLAQIVLAGNHHNLYIKKFRDGNEFDHFVNRLYAVTERRDCIFETKKKVTIYNSKKNKVYIQCEDGVVRDITEVSAKIRDYTVELCYVAVDVDQVYGLSEEETKNIKALFEDNPVEVEKKFEFPRNFAIMDGNEGLIFNNKAYMFMKKVLKSFDAFAKTEWSEVYNEDTYYKPIPNVPRNVAIRKRTACKGNSKNVSYFVKIPADDGTSITKREEYEYKCQSEEEFITLLSSLFKAKKYDTSAEIKLEKGVNISTYRLKALLTAFDSVIEIACDFSRYEYDGKVTRDMMLECELKEGDELALWYLTNNLKKQGFTVTNKSKLTRAKEALGV